MEQVIKPSTGLIRKEGDQTAKRGGSTAAGSEVWEKQGQNKVGWGLLSPEADWAAFCSASCDSSSAKGVKDCSRKQGREDGTRQGAWEFWREKT